PSCAGRARPHRSGGAGPPTFRRAEQRGDRRRPRDPARRREQAVRASARTPQGSPGETPGTGQARPMTEPRLSDEVDETSDHAVDDASDLVDQVAEEFAERCRRGESPSIEEYVRRYPEHSSKIRELLPSVVMMERLKRQVRAGTGAVPEAPEPTPERLGEEPISRALGRGGLGVVFGAIQESLNPHGAPKGIPPHRRLLRA